MCGIVGFFSQTSFSDTLDDKLKIMKHRGPDSEGIFEHKTNDLNVSLGHVRLSILDLTEEGSQPFSSKCGRYKIVYNGEIYNFQELKNKLPEHSFKSTSDTEVLIELIVKFGLDILNDLEGIFAFCVFDMLENKAFFVRDQLGVKPLYYYKDNEKFLFASELKPLFSFKGIEKRIDKNCLTEFLFNGFLYEPNTGFENVYKVMPGSYLELSFKNEDLHLVEHKYWKPSNNENLVISQDKFENEIEKTVNNQTISDVPVGLFYSGGIDSTIILIYLKNKIKSFIVTRDKESYEGTGMVNDYYYAQKISKHLDIEINDVNIENEVSNSIDFLDLVDKLTLKVEEPISDFTFISSELLSQKVKKEGFTVMLSGMGADEIFGGYPRYTLIKYQKLIKPFSKVVFPILERKKSFSKKINRLKSFIEEDSFVLKYSNLIGSFSKNEISDLLGQNYDEKSYSNKLENLLKGYEGLSDIKKAMVLDLYGFLSHNFIVADKSSMLQSIELRVPLASHKYYDMIFGSKTKLISLRKTKLILRNILYKYIPKKLVDRKKTGFNPPLDDLIRKIGADKCLEIFEKNNLFEYLDKKNVAKIVNEHFDLKSNNTFKVFQLLFISYWLKNNN